MQTKLKFHLLLPIWLVAGSCLSQIYPAADGVFILFYETPVKNTRVSLVDVPHSEPEYRWPTGSNDFIQAYRKAELIFKGPVGLKDEDLQKIWNKLDTQTEMGFTFQFSPTMLLALGQAAYIRGERPPETCQFISKESKANRTLTRTDQRLLTQQSTRVEKISTEQTSIHLKLIFPKNSWVDSARVYKKILGAEDSIQVFPRIYTTQLNEKIEMHIVDTSRTIGEYIYSIQPHDRLCIWHGKLKGIYAENYNSISAPGIKRFATKQIEGTKYIKLSWQVTQLPRVRGFEVFRSHHYDGPFSKIASLPAEDSTYVDHVEGVMQNFYYYVQILDQTGEGIKSITHFVVPLFKEKPTPPLEPSAISVKDGVCISWSTFDGLHQVRGYYVYRSDGDTSKWVQISNFIPIRKEVVSFTDTSQFLKPEVEYAYVVKSESTSYILSDPSIPAWGRPDKPRVVTAPQGMEWRYLEDGRLILYWEDTRIIDPYIVSYQVAETNQDQTKLQLIPDAVIDAENHSWTEQAASNKTDVQYCIVAQDAWGNKSACSASVQPYKSTAMIHPGNILVRPGVKGHQLQWGLPNDKHIKAIRLYEANESGTSTLVKSLTPTTTTYLLPLLKADEAKSFYITYQFDSGVESERGDIVVVRN